MKTLVASATVGLFFAYGATATAPITHAQPVQGPRTSCAKLFTVAQATRAAGAVYRGTRKVTHGDLVNLTRYKRCQRNPQAQGYVQWVYTHRRRAWRRRLWQAAHPLYGPETASWYDDIGATRCGFHAAYGVATLNGTPCGGTVTLYHNGHAVTAVRDDSGPYVGGRMFDLSPAAKAALHCGDLCTVYYRRP